MSSRYDEPREIKGRKVEPSVETSSFFFIKGGMGISDNTHIEA